MKTIKEQIKRDLSLVSDLNKKGIKCNTTNLNLMLQRLLYYMM
jgi:NADH/NAD ratio-sensing transcriptional regulator Rex